MSAEAKVTRSQGGTADMQAMLWALERFVTSGSTEEVGFEPTTQGFGGLWFTISLLFFVFVLCR